jgi:hypothetical protein
MGTDQSGRRSDVAEGVSRRSSDRCDETEVGDLSRGPIVTRRTVIGGLAAIVSSPALAADEGDIELVWNADRSALNLHLGVLPQWSLMRAAFADDADIHWSRSKEKLHVHINPVRFAGVTAFSIDLAFERQESVSGRRWQFSLTTGLLPGKHSAPIFLANFLANERGSVGIYALNESAPVPRNLPQIPLSHTAGQTLVDRLVGKNLATCDAPTRLNFLPDLSWLLHHADPAAKQPPIRLRISKLTATSLRFGRATPGRGPCRHRAADVPTTEANSFVVTFHGVAPRQMPVVIGKKHKVWGELTLNSNTAAAFERWPLPKPGDGQPPGLRREVLLVAGEGQFESHHGLGKRNHIDGPFRLDHGEIWWTRRGAAPWSVASALPLSSKIFSLKASFGTLEMRGGPDAAPISLIEKAGQFDIEGQAAITHVPRQVAGSDFSRLDLGGGVVEFELPNAKKKNAQHVLTLGSEGAARIPLESAALAISRSKDLVALRYRFKGLDLVLDAKSASVTVPRPSIPNTGAPVAAPATPVESLLVVELPPQHVAEQAVYRVLPEEMSGTNPDLDVVLPNVLVDAAAIDAQLKPLNLSTQDHDKRLAALVEAAKRKDPDYDHFIALYEHELGTTREPGSRIDPGVAQRALKKIQAEDDNKLPLMTRARLSGPTRVAFQVAPDAKNPKAQPWSANFDVASLTDFSKLDLKVVRRAMRYQAPSEADQQADENPLSLAKELAHFGIEEFGAGGADEDRWKSRMENIRSLMTTPGCFETSIELPTLLMLSPDNKAKWRTPRSRNVENVPYGHVPLWRMQLEQLRENGPQVRAIWSPDFRPDVFGGGGTPPDRGVRTPWFRTTMDAYDRHEIVALSSLHGLPVLPRLKDDGKLDGGQFAPPGPPEYPKNYVIWTSVDKDKRKEAIYRPRPLSVSELTLTAMGGSVTMDSAFEPPAGLGLDLNTNANITFSVERWRQQTVLGRDVVVEIVYKGFLFPLGHRCTLVKLTERKFLRNPQGGYTTAYLVQRMFLRIGKPSKIYPGKYQPDEARRWPLREVKFLTQWTPDIVDPIDDSSSAETTGPGFNGRISKFKLPNVGNGEGPIHNFKGLVFWPRTAKSPGKEILFKLELEGSAAAVEVPLIFVDNLAAHDPPTMAALCNYYQSLSTDETLAEPLDSEKLVKSSHGGTQRRYAEEEKRGSAGYETLAWIFGVEGRAPKPASAINNKFEMDALMEGADQPPFYPYIRRSQIRIKQLERLSGGAAHPVWARYISDYRLHGFGAKLSATGNAGAGQPPAQDPQQQNPVQVFLELLDKADLSFDSSGDRSGGVAKPNVLITALSRSNGPVGTGDKKAQPGDPLKFANFSKLDPESFFPKAKLLGIVDFKDLMTTASIVAGNPKPFPDIKQLINYAVPDLLSDDVVRTLAKGLKGIEVWTNLESEVWKKIEKNFVFYNAGGAGPKITVRDLLPGFARALNDVHGKMPEFVISNEFPERFAIEKARLQLTGIDFGGLYEAGQRLLAEIELIADDPVAPLKAEARKLLAELRATVMEALSSIAISNELKQAFESAARIDTDIEKLFSKWFTEAAGRQWRRSVLYLDEPHLGWPAGVPDLATRFIRCFARAAEIPEPIPPLTSEHWRKIILRFADNSNFEQDARKCFGEIAGALETYAASLTGLDRLVVELRTWVTLRVGSFRALSTSYKKTQAYNEYAEFVRRAYGIKQRISLILQREPRQLAEELTKELNAFLNFYKAAVVQQAQNLAPAELLEACTNAAGLFLAFAVTATPEPPEGALTCVVDPSQRGVSGAPEVLRPLVKTCSDIRDVLVSATRLIGALDNIEPALPATVRATERENLKTLIAQRKTDLLALVQSLVTTVGAAAQNINTGLAAWRTFVSVLTPDQAADFQAWVEGKVSAVCRDPQALTLSISQARALALATGESIEQTSKAFTESLTALKKVGEGWNLDDFTDQTIRAAVESARMELTIRIADVSNYLLQLLVQQTSAFEAAAQGEADNFRRAAKAAFATYAENTIAQLRNLGASVGQEADKLEAAFKAWQNDSTAARVENYVKKLNGELRQVHDAADKARQASLSPAEKLEYYAQAAQHVANLLGYDREFVEVKKQIDALRATVEQTLQEQLYSITNLRNIVERDVIDIVLRLVVPMLDILDGTYKVIEQKRDETEGKFKADRTTAVIFEYLQIRKVLHVDEIDGKDQIQKDEETVAGIRDQAASGTPLAPADINALITIVTVSDSSIVRLFNQIVSASEAVLRLDLGRFIDFAEIRNTVENEIKALVPADVSLSYDYSTKFKPQGALKDLFDMSREDADLRNFREVARLPTESEDNFIIRARAHTNILTGARSAMVEGYLAAFQIKLFTKAFDVVTLFFDGASFKSVDGGKPTFHTNLVKSELGPEVEFLKQLEAWLCGGKGNGFFLKFTTQPMFGIEAGYRFGLPIISIGTVSFSNVGLEASVMLPFEAGEALFHIALSSRDNPFLISAAPYGGGGHVGLYANAKKIVAIEASFEFGGVGAFSFGPLSGIGRLTTGIFVSKSESRGATIQGHFFAGGSARIWIFGMSTSLTVRMGQANGGSMCGSAVYSYAFSYGIDEIEFQVPVWRQEGKGFSGDGARADNFDDLGGTRYAQLNPVNDAGPAAVTNPPMPPTTPPDHATPAQLKEWQEKWDNWKTANLGRIEKQQRDRAKAERDRLTRITPYGVKITSKVATREHEWCNYSNYFDPKLIPED